MEKNNVRPFGDLPPLPPMRIPYRALPRMDNKKIQISTGGDMQTIRQIAKLFREIDIEKEIVRLLERANNYLRKAFGIGTEPEPPIIADHPPIHMVDGELRLGNKGEQDA